MNFSNVTPCAKFCAKMGLSFVAETANVAKKATVITGATAAAAFALDTGIYVTEQHSIANLFCGKNLPLSVSFYNLIENDDPCLSQVSSSSSATFFTQALALPLIPIVTFVAASVLQKIENGANYLSQQLNTSAEQRVVVINNISNYN